MKSITKDYSLTEAVKELKGKQEFLINYNNKKVKEINDRNKEIQDKKKELDELKSNINKVKNDGIETIHKENDKILKEIRLYNTNRNNEIQRLEAYEKKLLHKDDKLNEKESNINNILKENIRIEKLIVKEKRSLTKLKNDLKNIESYLEDTRQDTLKNNRYSKSLKEKMNSKSKLLDKEYDIKRQKIEQDKEIVDKQKMVNRMERNRIDTEWIKIKDQWKQLKSAREFINK